MRQRARLIHCIRGGSLPADAGPGIGGCSIPTAVGGNAVDLCNLAQRHQPLRAGARTGSGVRYVAIHIGSDAGGGGKRRSDRPDLVCCSLPNSVAGQGASGSIPHLVAGGSC